MEREVVEYLPDDPIAQPPAGERIVLHNLTMTLERAERDQRVVGLVARLGAAKVPVATLQELRGDHSVSPKGKFAIAFAETFGEFQTGSVPTIWRRHLTKFGCSRRATLVGWPDCT